MIIKNLNVYRNTRFYYFKLFLVLLFSRKLAQFFKKSGLSLNEYQENQ